MKKDSKSDVSLNEMLTCDMDTESIAQILRKNIEAELNCLENHLKFFVDVVDTDRPGYLSYKELKKYIEKNLPEVDQETIIALSGIFDISTLLFGDDLGYIERENVTRLTKAMIQFNSIFVEADVYNFFTDRGQVTFHEHNRRKSKVYTAMMQIKKVFSRTFIENDKTIDITEFIKKFKALGNEDIIKNAESLVFLKRAVLGGQREIMSGKEFGNMIQILPDVIKITFDFVNIPDTKTDAAYQDEEILKILKEDVETAKRNFFFKDEPQAAVLNYDDIKGVFEQFLPQFCKFINYKNSFLTLKGALVGESSEVFTAKEVMILLDDILFENLSKGINFYKFYEQNKSEMDSFYSISNHFRLTHYVDLMTEKKHLDEFNRIAQEYRYFLGHEFSPTYDIFFNRNPRGAYEIAIYESLVSRIFKAFGSKNAKAVGGYSMTLEQLEGLMIELGDLFEGEGWIMPGRSQATAETITLMTSLFHHQSDGDSNIEVNEFTEFAVTMLTSLNLSDKMFKSIPEFCEVDEKGRYSAQCFRDNIKKIMQIPVSEGKTISSFMPKLDVYINSLEDKELQNYFIKTAKFSRTCSKFDDGVERPMEESDGIVTWAGLIAIEQSMMRFDVDHSNILEPDELDEAYKIYEAAIQALIPVDALKGQSKKVFQYMVKYKKVPEIPEIKGFKSFWKAVAEAFTFAKFAWFKKKKNRLSDADRMTFAAVLEIIAENSPSALDNPYPCETLR